MFDYGKKLVELRKTNRVSSKQLAEILSVTTTQISRIENGKSMPSVQLLDQIIGYFGISYSDFFNDDTNFTEVTVSKENGTNGINAKITSDELDMIMAYRKASMPEKTAINVLLEQYKSKGELEVKHA